MDKKLKAAVIGLTIGTSHVHDYLNNPNVCEVVPCDLNPEKLAAVQEKYGLTKGYADYKEMLAAEKPDIVGVCVPNFLHKQVVTDALESGAHVLSEKPLARTAEEGREIQEVSRRTGRKLMVNFNRRYLDSSIALKEWIEQGKLGRIYYVVTKWQRVRGVPWWYPLDDAKRKVGGGPMIDLGVHTMDLCMWLCGYPEAEWVSGRAFSEIAPREAADHGFASLDVEDMGVAMVTMKNGMMMEVEASWASNSEIPTDNIEVRLYGTEGGAVIKAGCDKCSLVIIGKKSEVEVQPLPEPTRSLTIRDAFVKAVLEDTEVPCTPDQAIAISRIIDCVYESTRTGAPLKV